MKEQKRTQKNRKEKKRNYNINLSECIILPQNKFRNVLVGLLFQPNEALLDLPISSLFKF